MSGYYSILVTSQDFDRIHDSMISAVGLSADRLNAELARAQIIEPSEAPRSLVTMNSQLTYENTDTGEKHTVRLVYPRDADVSKNQISVLAPLGTALLGLREGQAIDWEMPRGTRRIKILKVAYQPEAAGDWEL